jgi:hypothetical protein
VDVVAQLAQDRPERAGGDVVGEQARKDDDGVAVTVRESLHQGAGGEVEAVVRDGAAGLAEVERKRRTVVLPPAAMS